MDAKGRDLMNRLADALEDFYDREYGWVEDGHGCPVIEEARAYLATPPEPAAPTEDCDAKRLPVPQKQEKL